MRKLLASIIVLLLFGVKSSMAQTVQVTGRVLDSASAPLAGASIREKGTKNGVSAGNDGRFIIKVRQGATLVISAIGYAPTEVSAASTVTVSLQSDNRSGNLNEVVVTAQGIRRNQKELGYAATNVTPTEITAGRSPNLGQALSGKVAGLTIYNTNNSVNASPRIVLRGTRSITGDNTALIVLDGVPVPSNTINYINPNDIESVSILKGGQAATLYGSDGVNGAVVITTKKGRAPQISVTHSSNLERVSFLPKTQHEFGSGSGYGYSFADNFRPYENQQYGDRYDGSLRSAGRVLQDGSYQVYPYADIEDIRKKIWNSGYTAQTDVSYSAGDEKGNFYASYQNLSTSGVVPKDTYGRNSLRLNATKVYGKFSIGFDATYTWERVKRTTSDFYNFALNTPSWIPLDQLKDWQNNKFANPNGYFNDFYNNPWYELDNSRSDAKNTYFNGNVHADLKLASFLNLTGRIAIANTNSYSLSWVNPFTYNDWAKNGAYTFDPKYNDYSYIYRSTSNITGSLTDGASYGNRMNTDVFLTFRKTFGDFSANAILGNNVQIRTSQGVSASTNLAQPNLLNLANNSLNGIYSASDSRSEVRKVGNYLDATFGYKNYLFLHGSVRNDFSSVFYATSGRTLKNANYTTGGGDVSFIVTDAIPVLKSNVLSYLKIRGGYNVNRNDNLDPYSLQNTFPNAAGFPYSGGLQGQTISGTLFDSINLKPETVKSIEVGFEMQLLKGRISLEGSFYNQNNDGQILSVATSATTGFTTYVTNAAEMNNKGFEGSLKVNVLRNRDWSVNVTGNYTYMTNKVSRLYVDNGLNKLTTVSGTNVTLNAVVGQMFPYLQTTAWQRTDQGQVIVDATDGWPLRNSTFVGQGNTAPHHVVGLGINTSWKNFTLIANAEYRGGYVVYNNIGETMAFTGSAAITNIYHRQQFIWPNSVTVDGSGKYVPNTNLVDPYIAMYEGWGDASFTRGLSGIGEVFVSSGAFWKLRDISLGYDIPKSILGNQKAIKGINISVWGRNLKTWLAKDNWYTDPEFSNTTGNSIGVNTTGNTPPTRQMGATIRATF